MANALANSAFFIAADRSIQFHSGFGFTYDYDSHLYRRRALGVRASGAMRCGRSGDWRKCCYSI